jgi:3-oxoacyl-[acyl-carrier protein] reductase/bacilysin biosynthesis oxidoreductase BacG
MNLGLEGKKVVVTGASRGIGEAIAEAFASEGSELALLARSQPALQQLATRLSAQVRATAIVADLAQADDARVAIDRAIGALGGIDVLVNNAGTSPFGSFDVISDHVWQDAFNLKLMGYVRCTRAVLPAMRMQQSGTIINVVGMAGRNATPGYALGAFNAALLHLTKSLSELVASDGIRVSAINPGFTTTERMSQAMQVWAREANVDIEKYTEDYVRRLPLGRFAEPAEIARLVVLLASDVMELTTGSALQADGGSARGQF